MVPRIPQSVHKMRKADSDGDMTRLIILLDFKCFYMQAFIHSQHVVSVGFLFGKKPMILHGSMTFKNTSIAFT